MAAGFPCGSETASPLPSGAGRGFAPALAEGASPAQGPRCTPGSLVPIQQPHFSHFMLIIFCTVLCKFFPEREGCMEMYVPYSECRQRNQLVTSASGHAWSRSIWGC